MKTLENSTTHYLPNPVESIPLEAVQGWSEEALTALPTFSDQEQDYTAEWGKTLQGSENDFPFEASFANHYFVWPHIINGELRTEFDCTKVDSFKYIPPGAYIAAYTAAKERGEI
jgi:hypothetical protein